MKDEPKVSFERWNDLSVEARHLSEEEFEELLLEEELSYEDYRQAGPVHLMAIVAGLSAGDSTLADACAARVGKGSTRGKRASATAPQSSGATAAATAVVSPSYMLAAARETAPGGRAAPVREDESVRVAEQAARFDADETLPIPAPFVAGPAVPFSGERSTADAASMVQPVEPKARAAEPGANETALLPQMTLVPRKSGNLADRLGPVAVPLLSLDEYAELRAHLSVFGEEHRATLARFAVEAREVREALRARFADFFQRDPRAQAQFLEKMERIARTLQLDRETEP